MESSATTLPRCRITTCEEIRSTISNSCELKSTTLPRAANSWIKLHSTGAVETSSPEMSAQIGWPSRKISPPVVSRSPVIIFMVVDLPDPFGPRVSGDLTSLRLKTQTINGKDAGESLGNVAEFERHRCRIPTTSEKSPLQEPSSLSHC